MSVYDTIGIEVETDMLNVRFAASVIGNFSSGEFKVENDASIQSHTYRSRNGSTLITKKFNPMSSRELAGMEFVSSPMTLPRLRYNVRKLTGLLRTMGESETSNRSSIHIHVGCNPKLPYLQNALNLFSFIEPLFYRLGSMGYKFRGASNSAIYCRPITNKFGPPAVQGESGRFFSLFNPEDLKSAKTIEEFFYIMAIDPNNIMRYHPSRYFGLNLFSTILHGTLEFRFFNKTLDHMKISAVASLCQCITEFCVENKSPIVFPPIENPTDEERFQFLLDLIKEKNETYKIEDTDIHTLQNIISSSSPYRVPDEYVKSHLTGKWRLSDYWAENYRRERIPSEELHESGFIDIHNIGNLDILNTIT